MGFRRTVGDGARISGAAIFATILVIVCVGLGVLAYNESLPWQLDKQRQAVQHSQQYVETKASLLLKWERDVRQLEGDIADIKAVKPVNQDSINSREAQIEATLQDIIREGNTIPRDAVPQSVIDLLSEYNKHF